MGDVTTPGYPFRVLGEDDLPAPEWGPAPALGEHNAELLRDELGYDLAELQRLRVV